MQRGKENIERTKERKMKTRYSEGTVKRRRYCTVSWESIELAKSRRLCPTTTTTVCVSPTASACVHAESESNVTVAAVGEQRNGAHCWPLCLALFEAKAVAAFPFLGGPSGGGIEWIALQKNCQNSFE